MLFDIGHFAKHKGVQHYNGRFLNEKLKTVWYNIIGSKANACASWGYINV